MTASFQGDGVQILSILRDMRRMPLAPWTLTFSEFDHTACIKDIESHGLQESDTIAGRWLLKYQVDMYTT